MEEKKSFLTVMSVPGIDEYVYGTSKLAEIRGASGLLDWLNRKETEDFLVGQLQSEQVDRIFAGGGEAQFILRSTDRGLRNSLRELKAHFLKESRGGLRLYCGVAELRDGNYRKALNEAYVDLEKEEQEEPFDTYSPLHCGYIRECDSCSGMLYRTDENQEEDRILCKVCQQKLKHGRMRRLWTELVDYLLRVHKDIPQAFRAAPKDFEEIGELCKARRGYTALVYADGNRMTSLLRKIDDKDQFRFFSYVIDKSIREACYEAIYSSCPPAKLNGSTEEKIPCDILLLGGDDLLVYMSAETALPFVIDVSRRFQEKTQRKFAGNPFFAELLKEKGLTLSFGIAYGKSHTPFSIMFHQAKELLRSAKAAGDLDTRAEGHFIPSYVDYHLTSYFSQMHVEECRKTHLRLPGRGTSMLWLYSKPYSIDDAGHLLAYARRLLQSQIPRSRLKRFGDVPAFGMVKGTLEFIKAYVRTEEKERSLIWDALARFNCAGDVIPWCRHSSRSFSEDGSPTEMVIWKTVLMDLIELTEFISAEER